MFLSKVLITFISFWNAPLQSFGNRDIVAEYLLLTAQNINLHCSERFQRFKYTFYVLHSTWYTYRTYEKNMIRYKIKKKNGKKGPQKLINSARLCCLHLFWSSSSLIHFLTICAVKKKWFRLWILLKENTWIWISCSDRLEKADTLSCSFILLLFSFWMTSHTPN